MGPLISLLVSEYYKQTFIKQKAIPLQGKRGSWFQREGCSLDKRCPQLYLHPWQVRGCCSDNTARAPKDSPRSSPQHITKDHPVITVIALIFIRLTALAASYRLLLPSSWEPSKVVRCCVPLSGSLSVLRRHRRMGSIPKGNQCSSGPARGTFNTHASLSASSPPPRSIANHAAVTLHDRAGSLVLFHSIGHMLRNQCLTVGMGSSCWPDAERCTGWDGRRESSERPVGWPTEALAAPWEFKIDTPQYRLLGGDIQELQGPKLALLVQVLSERVEGCPLWLVLTLPPPTKRFLDIVTGIVIYSADSRQITDKL